MKSFTSYDLENKQFPQRLPPWRLILLKAMSTLAKFALPLVLESIYQNLQHSNDPHYSETQSLIEILLKITISLSLSYFLELYCEYILVDYRLNLKKQLGKRILENTIQSYIQSKKQSVFHINELGTHSAQQIQKEQNTQSFSGQKLSIWTNLSNKMPVYVYNYHNSLLSLFFQSLNIIGVSVYLFMKLSYSLFFGLVLALLIMKKIVKVTQNMQQRFFNNIQLRQKKLNLLKNFFQNLVQYKMTWLDKWIFDRIRICQDEYQDNLEQIKYLDVWCVALWKFTSVSISSIVVIAFYFLGIQATQTITPSTLIQFLMILTMPLNALSWNIAGVRNSLRAIKELKQTVSTLKKDQVIKMSPVKLSSEFKMLPDEEFIIKFDKQNRTQKYFLKHEISLTNGAFYQAKGLNEVENFLRVLPFILRNNTSEEIGYVEENSWQIDNILESLTFKNIEMIESERQEFPSLPQLLQVFQCHEIPQFSTITAKNLSGGEKMRINLVRAFFNAKIIIINSDLTSLDLKMRQKISEGIEYLVKKYGYCIICRQIKAISQKTLNNKIKLTFTIKDSNQEFTKKQRIIQIHHALNKKTQDHLNNLKKDSLKIKISKQIQKKVQSSLKDEKNRDKQKQAEEDPQKSDLGFQSQQNFDNLKWKTFTSYYQSKYHLVFLIGIICTTFFEHLYQFYMNNYVKIEHIHDGSGLSGQNIKIIILLTILFAGALFVRAFYFAFAGIKESRRLSKQLDQNVIMNEMGFYENFTDKNIILPVNQQSQDLSDIGLNDGVSEGNKRTSQLGSKLIYHCTTDIAQVSDNYPWQANILFNNIATTLSSVLIVFSQIPFIGVILIPIILLTVLWNSKYQNESQRLLKIQKRVEQHLLKTVHEIEEGIKIIYLYRKVQTFKQFVYKSINKQINIEWKLSELKRKLNTKYKLMMICFLIIIVLAFGFTGHFNRESQSKIQFEEIEMNSFEQHIFQKFGQCSLQNSHFYGHQRNKYGKFAMLINYTIILANFMLYFTVSLGDTFTHALAIQRLRPLLSDQNSLNSQQRLKDFQKIFQKLKKMTSISSPIDQIKEPMISIKGLDFSYSKKNKKADHKMVFSDLDFQLSQKQKFQLRGKSGDGKTTLYKILCSLYKDHLNTIDYPFHISFSPQHPLILPMTKTVASNLDPYRIFSSETENVLSQERQNQQLTKIVQGELGKNSNLQTATKNIKIVDSLLNKSLHSLTYEEKILINNFRAWLYGKNGIKIYDEPYWVDESEGETYIITTHQRQFQHSKTLLLENKKIVQK